MARFLDRTRGPELGEKLRAAVESYAFVLPGGGVLNRTCSIGIAPFPFAASGGDGARWEQVVDAADAALYAAKASGRNSWISVELRQESEGSAVLAALREHAAGAMDHQGLLVRRRAGQDREA